MSEAASQASASIYRKFGLSEAATIDEIEAVYRTLALQWHPSKHPGDAQAAQRFRQLANAYFVLTDPIEKPRYDASLQQEQPFRISQQPPAAETVFEQVLLRRASALAASHNNAERLFETLRAEGYPLDMARRLADSLMAAMVDPLLDLPPVPSGVVSKPNIELSKPAEVTTNPIADQSTEPPAAAQRVEPSFQPYAPPSAAIPLQAALADGEQLEYAGFWERFAASFVDSMIYGVISWVVSFGVIMGLSVSGSPGAGFVLAQLLSILVGMLYYALQESGKHRASIGKRLLGLQVLTVEQERIGLGRAIGRFFGRYLSALLLMIGYLMQPFNQRKQALHDLICSTVVVRRADRKGGAAGVVIAIIVGVFVLIFVVGILAAIAIPQYAEYQKRAMLKGAMFEARVAVQQVAAISGTLPDRKVFPSSVEGMTVEFVKEEAAVVVNFSKGALEGQTLYAFTSANSGKLCYEMKDAKDPGINNCPAGEYSALVDPEPEAEEPAATPAEVAPDDISNAVNAAISEVEAAPAQ